MFRVLHEMFDNTYMEGTGCIEWRHVSCDHWNRVQNL